MRKLIGILPVFLFWSAMLFAQGKLTASVSKSRVGVGEQFEVDFTTNAGGTSFTPPDFGNFQVLSGRNMSSDVTSINGNTTITVTYSYILAAKKEGTFSIDAAAIVIGGRTVTSNPVKIIVKGQAPPAAQQQAQAQQPATPDDNVSTDTKDLSKQIFIRAVVDKTRAYLGEQIKLSYKIYTRTGILGGQPDKAPDLNGFWSQDVGSKNQNANWRPETYKGVKYNVATIKQTILFPQRSGDLVVDPFVMTFVLRLQLPVKDILGSFYNDFKDVKYQTKSTPVIIHVIPLPAEGKPADFSGAVGNFSVYGNVDKPELKANETLNYTMDISGSGNLNLINAPQLNFPVDFEKYSPKTNDHINVDSTGVSGSRQFSYLLIPRQKGDYVINPAAFTYFNPKTARYVTLQTKAFRIKVNKGDAQANVPAFNSSEQQDIRLLGNDIRYIKTSAGNLHQEGEGFYNSAWYYVLLLLGPALFLAAVFYRRWNLQYNADAVKVKSRAAGKMASKHLALAQKELTAGNRTAFYNEVAKGLNGYLSDKLNIPVAELSKENITARLQARNLEPGIISQLTQTLDLCEMARFAPVTGISEQQVFNQAKNTINEIETKI